MKFESSSLANKLYNDMNNAKMIWDTQYSEPFYKGLLEGIAECMGTLKGDKPKAVVVKSEGGTIIFGAYVEKNPAEEGYGYSINFVFSGDDIPEDAEVYDINDNVPYGIITMVLRDKYRCYIKSFNGQPVLERMAEIAITSLKEYMRSNYDVDKTLELTNYFKVTAEIDDGNRLHMSFTPEAILKQHIKDDESAQK